MSIQSNAAEGVWRIQPTPSSFAGQLAALWRHRKVSTALARQVIANGFERRLFGLPWMLVQPIMYAWPAVFVLGKVFNVSVAPLPLPIFIVSGLAVWIFVRRGVQAVTRSLGAHGALMRRIYIPVFLLLCTSISPAAVQFLMFIGILAALALYYGPIAGIFYIPLGWHLLALAPAILLIVLLVIGVGSFTCILFNIRRDTGLALKYGMGSWMLVTPVVYPPEIIPESHRWLLYLNPLTPVVELFRWALLGYGTVNIPSLCLGIVVIFLMLLIGGTLFSKLQNRLFDHM
jgi:lipopolysaccharide transport system permease protein